MTTLEDVEQRPGAAFAYGLKNKRGEPLRSPRKSKAPFSPRKETLWGYKDTKVEHKKVPPVPLIRHKRGHRPKLHDSLTLSIRKANEPMPQTDSFVWLVERSVADFRTQGRYQPAASEVKAALPHLLRDLTHIKGELGFDEFVEFAKLTLNSNGGKIVPKLEELKECFYHIDADGGGTLDKHEIFHALSVNWELIKFLRGSATLKPLLSLRNWKKAMINMKEPDKRHESSCKLVEMTADARNAKLVADIGALKLFVNLLRPENGAVAVNIAGALANMIWHCRELQNKIPFELQNFEIYENKDRTCGLVPLLLCENIDDDAKATVLTAMHNFCWNNQSNKIDLADSFLGPMEHELIRLRDHGGTTRARRVASALMTMLMIHT